MLAATGMVFLGGGTAMLAGALYYMVSSTLAIGALFLLVELLERKQGGVAAMLAVTAEAYGFGDEEARHRRADRRARRPRHDDRPRSLLRRLRYPARRVAAAVRLRRQVRAPVRHAEPDRARRRRHRGQSLSLAFTALLIFSGLAALVALLRVGIQTFWVPSEEDVPKVLLIEIAPVIALLAVTVAITVEARPVMRYMQATAAALHRPQVYVEGVLGAPRVPEADEAEAPE